MPHIFIGIGSSLNRQKNIQLSVLRLKDIFGDVIFSSVFESEAVGFKGKNFYNLVAEFDSDLPIEQLISTLKKIEVSLGRDKKLSKHDLTTIDLDLLLYDQLIDEKQNVPRAEIIENAFVLQPLAELAPNLIHPILAISYKELWDKYPATKQKLWKVALPTLN